MTEFHYRWPSPQLLLLFAVVGGTGASLFYGQTILTDGSTFYLSDVSAHAGLIRQWAEGDLFIPHFGLALLVVAVRALTPFDLSWAIVAVLSTSLLASVWTMWLVV